MLVIGNCVLYLRIARIRILFLIIATRSIPIDVQRTAKFMFLREFVRFIAVRKKHWLVAVLLIIVAVGGLLAEVVGRRPDGSSLEAMLIGALFCQPVEIAHDFRPGKM
jgi:hypothetical protein